MQTQQRKEYLKEYRAKKKAIANKIPPTAPPEERKQLLTKMIRLPLPASIDARSRVLAISELNRMEGSYPVEKHALLGNILIEVVYEARKKLIQVDSVQIEGGEDALQIVTEQQEPLQSVTEQVGGEDAVQIEGSPEGSEQGSSEEKV